MRKHTSSRQTWLFAIAALAATVVIACKPAGPDSKACASAKARVEEALAKGDLSARSGIGDAQLACGGYVPELLHSVERLESSFKDEQAAKAQREAAAAPPTVEQQIANAATLEAILPLIDMRDMSGEDLDPGVATFAVWANDHLKWSDISGEPTTSIGKVAKDPDAERKKHGCWSGSLIEIHADNSVKPATFQGGLLTPSADVVRFIAVGSSGALVKDSPARLCGVVTGLQAYANSIGGLTHAMFVVGMFDLTANHPNGTSVPQANQAAPPLLPALTDKDLKVHAPAAP